jgi:hypothetical protein
MPNKKIFFVIFPIIILAIVFSPYTIVKLTSYGQDFFSDDLNYQAQETQIANYQNQEQAALAELAKIDAQLNVKNTSIAGAEDESSTATVFDPAIAPGTVSAEIFLSDTKKVPDFSVRLKFIAVGEKSFETKTDKNGKMEISLASGRYYAEVIPEDNTYRLEGDAPAFFLSANSQKDLGELYLIKK